MTGPDSTTGDSPAELPDLVAAVVQDHPCVLRLHSGEFGVIGSPLRGRRVVGVRAEEVGQPVEVGVVLRLDRPLPGIIAELRTRVQTVTGAVPVDITVSEVVLPTAEQDDTEAPPRSAGT